jgi:hypothetical protein
MPVALALPVPVTRSCVGAYHKAHLPQQTVAGHGRVSSVEIVEAIPIIDEHNPAAHSAVDLACLAFEEAILCRGSFESCQLSLRFERVRFSRAAGGGVYMALATEGMHLAI